MIGHSSFVHPLVIFLSSILSGLIRPMAGGSEIVSGIIRKVIRMAQQLPVNTSASYQVVWFDGPNGTGNQVQDPGATVFASDNTANMTVASPSNQNATVTGVAVGTANLSATSSNNVVAGYLDANNSYVAGPLPFDIIAAVGAIVSGVIRPVATMVATGR